MKNLFVGCIIGIILTVIFFSISKLSNQQTLQSEKKINISSVSIPTPTPRFDLLHIKNQFSMISFLKTIDINNDGIQEIIYEPQSLSRDRKTYLLKETFSEENALSLFCEHCIFDSFNAPIDLKDVNNDKLLDIVIPFSLNEENTLIRDTIYFFDGRDYIRQ